MKAATVSKSPRRSSRSRSYEIWISSTTTTTARSRAPVTFHPRTRSSKRRALARISSIDIDRSSRGCSCHNRRMLSSSFTSAPLVVKLAGQQLLDAVNLRSDVPGRQARDLGNRRRVYVLEVEEDDLPVDRPKIVDQLVDAVERAPSIKLRLSISLVGYRFQHGELRKRRR